MHMRLAALAVSRRTGVLSVAKLTLGWGYVACSRARAATHVYLAESDAIERETPLREPTPTSPLERSARALERSSAEPLALDQSRERRDTRMRLIAERQEQLERDRERTAKRLEAAQRELGRLHWWNRDSRAKLETEIALHRAALERADRKRQELRQLAERRSPTLALFREHDKLAPALRPEPPRPRLEREPPGLALEL
jgi:pimeloyl-ACP methyl ester carboxylesterase